LREPRDEEDDKVEETRDDAQTSEKTKLPPDSIRIVNVLGEEKCTRVEDALECAGNL
jgi:hypothetical protein